MIWLDSQKKRDGEKILAGPVLDIKTGKEIPTRSEKPDLSDELDKLKQSGKLKDAKIKQQSNGLTLIFAPITKGKLKGSDSACRIGISKFDFEDDFPSDLKNVLLPVLKKCGYKPGY